MENDPINANYCSKCAVNLASKGYKTIENEVMAKQI